MSYSIIVNAKRKLVSTQSLGYEDVVKMAGMKSMYGPTIAYRSLNRCGQLMSGVLAPLGSVAVTDGMIFLVSEKKEALQ